MNNLLFLFPKAFQNEFLKHMEDTSDQIQQYENKNLQELGRRSIPLERLHENVLNQMRRMQKSISSKAIDENDPCFRDFLLVELARWFHEEFFTWVNTLPCKVCGIEQDGPKYTFIDDSVRVEVINENISIDFQMQTKRIFFNAFFALNN